MTKKGNIMILFLFNVCYFVEKCFEKNPKLKKTNWFYMLQENSICSSHIIFYFFNFKGGVPYFIFLVPLIISKCRFMLKRRFPKLIIMKYE